MIPSECYGIVVPVDDPAALTAALTRALSMPWDRGLISSWGRRRSWVQVATEVLHTMQRVRSEFMVDASKPTDDFCRRC